MADLRAENVQLRQQLAQSQQTVAQQAVILHQRAEPLLAAIVDALATLAQMAEQGHPGARDLLAKWVSVQQVAQDAGSKLTIVRGGNGQIPR